MPATIREIAEACGVSKTTVTNNLRAMGLWDYHVKPGDPSHPALVDDEAASAVAARIGTKKPLNEVQETTLGEPKFVVSTLENSGLGTNEQLYEQRINDLKEQIRDLQSRLDAADKRNENLTERVGSMAEAMRALPSADDVTRAREDGEEAGRAAGEAEERAKVAAMGFWERRKYLRMR